MSQPYHLLGLHIKIPTWPPLLHHPPTLTPTSTTLKHHHKDHPITAIAKHFINTQRNTQTRTREIKKMHKVSNSYKTKKVNELENPIRKHNTETKKVIFDRNFQRRFRPFGNNSGKTKARSEIRRSGRVFLETLGNFWKFFQISTTVDHQQGCFRRCLKFSVEYQPKIRFLWRDREGVVRIEREKKKEKLRKKRILGFLYQGLDDVVFMRPRSAC